MSPWREEPARTAAAVMGLVGPYLAGQRWARRDADPSGELRLEAWDQIQADPDALWMLVRSGPDLYQLLVGLRPAASPIGLGERETLGTLEDGEGSWLAYDGMADAEIVRPLASSMGVAGIEDCLVRPVGAEQSNSSVVLGQRVILKLYRRVQAGPNPDIEVTTALDRVGFNHLASPLGVWRRDGYDLAVAQEFLAGGSEGWAMAVTSLRDLYASAEDDPALAGGDFASEAHRLGEMTARLHVALAAAFGVEPAHPREWAEALVERAAALSLGSALLGRVRQLAAGVAAGDAPVPSIRVHGDYHLGQVMRTDAGWFVLDFEGEPARPLEERRRAWPAAKDVAGMLRSFDYAAGATLAERLEARRDDLEERARAWEERNRRAFLDGYLSVPGVGPLFPGGDPAGASGAGLLAFFELDKALYELGYERAHRPDWEPIPRSAIERLLDG